MEYKDAQAVQLECSICEAKVDTSHLPTWLYKLKNLAALNFEFNPVLCKCCHDNYSPGLARVAMLAVADRMNHCQRNQP